MRDRASSMLRSGGGCAGLVGDRGRLTKAMSGCRRGAQTHQGRARSPAERAVRAGLGAARCSLPQRKAELAAVRETDWVRSSTTPRARRVTAWAASAARSARQERANPGLAQEHGSAAGEQMHPGLPQEAVPRYCIARASCRATSSGGKIDSIWRTRSSKRIWSSTCSRRACRQILPTESYSPRWRKNSLASPRSEVNARSSSKACGFRSRRCFLRERNPPALFRRSLIDAISDGAIEAAARGPTPNIAACCRPRCANPRRTRRPLRLADTAGDPGRVHTDGLCRRTGPDGARSPAGQRSTTSHRSTHRAWI